MVDDPAWSRRGGAESRLDEGESRPTGGLRSQVKPAFMAPVVATALFGGLLAPTFDGLAAALHVPAAASALYLAHLIDEYVDAHVRGEEPPLVPMRHLRPAIVLSALGSIALVASLWVVGRPAAAVATAPLLVLAVLHAPVLDRRPITGTLGYPVGIFLVLIGGYLAQVGTVSRSLLGLAAVFVPVLAGAKITIDRLDAEFDRRIGKQTIPVRLGDHPAARVSALCFFAAVTMLTVVALVSSLTIWTLLAAPALLAGGVVGLDESARRALRRQMALTYPFAIVVFGTQCVATGCVVAWFGELLFAVGERLQL